MNEDTKTYLITIALFSLILFIILVAINGGTEDFVTDSLLTILTVSYIVNNLPSSKK